MESVVDGEEDFVDGGEVADVAVHFEVVVADAVVLDPESDGSVAW